MERQLGQDPHLLQERVLRVTSWHGRHSSTSAQQRMRLNSHDLARIPSSCKSMFHDAQRQTHQHGSGWRLAAQAACWRLPRERVQSTPGRATGKWGQGRRCHTCVAAVAAPKQPAVILAVALAYAVAAAVVVVCGVRSCTRGKQPHANDNDRACSAAPVVEMQLQGSSPEPSASLLRTVHHCPAYLNPHHHLGTPWLRCRCHTTCHGTPAAASHTQAMSRLTHVFLAGSMCMKQQASQGAA
jgi:hypothetical protein